MVAILQVIPTLCSTNRVAGGVPPSTLSHLGGSSGSPLTAEDFSNTTSLLEYNLDLARDGWYRGWRTGLCYSGTRLLSRSVDVCSMVDVDHVDRVLVDIYLVDAAICTYPCRVKSRQVAPQPFANSLRPFEKRSQDVVDDRDGNLLG